MIEIKRPRQPAEEIHAGRAQKPADGAEVQGQGEHIPGAEPALKREKKPFTGMDSARDYSAMYRAAFQFHRDHNPPRIDREYWQTHTPGADDIPQAEVDYWEGFGRDVMAACNRFAGDPFFISLLVAIGDELQREYKAVRAFKAQG